MTDKLPTRRTILSGLGSIAALTGLGAAGENKTESGTKKKYPRDSRRSDRRRRDRRGDGSYERDDHQKQESDQPTQESKPRLGDGTLKTLACGEWPDFQDKKGYPVEGKLEICNCSPCTRMVIINVSGEIFEAGETFDGSVSLHVRTDEKRTVYFTGSLTGLDIEDGDVNVAVSQRSLHESDASQCVRPCERC